MARARTGWHPAAEPLDAFVEELRASWVRSHGVLAGAPWPARPFWVDRFAGHVRRAAIESLYSLAGASSGRPARR